MRATSERREDLAAAAARAGLSVIEYVRALRREAAWEEALAAVREDSDEGPEVHREPGEGEDPGSGDPGSGEPEPADAQERASRVRGPARSTCEGSVRPTIRSASAATSIIASRSMPVSMPMSSTMCTSSSVAMLPEAPGA
jgi:hypothetical protein